MKTEINIQDLIQNLNLDYPEIMQITDDADGYIRLIGYVSDLPIYREKRWFITAEIITINPSNMKVLKIEPAQAKNRDWVIDNNYLAIVTENMQPITNPNFQSDLDISLENSPYQLIPAFDFYFGIRHSKITSIKMPELFEKFVTGNDRLGYFDKKPEHIELIDEIKSLYEKK